MHEELERLWRQMGTLHILHNIVVVDTINIISTPSALQPQV
jgi:hypothetical protein